MLQETLEEGKSAITCWRNLVLSSKYAPVCMRVPCGGLFMPFKANKIFEDDKEVKRQRCFFVGVFIHLPLLICDSKRKSATSTFFTSC